MTDAPAPSTAADPRSRARFAPFLLLLSLLAASIFVGWFWYEGRTPAAALSATGAPSAISVTPVNDPRVDRLLTQLTDLERVNSVLRQQVLALTERVTVLGDQMSLHARDAGSDRMDVRGQTALALADQWLSLAQARLELFADPAGALLALDTADRALQGSSHPRVPSLRQTLSIERESMRVAPLLDTARVAGQLEAWQQALGSWPVRAPSEPNAAPEKIQSQILSRLDRYFRVRPLEAVLDQPVSAELSAISAELAWARVLLARGERAALHVSLQRCSAAIEQRFDIEDPGVQAALTGLQELTQALSNGAGASRLGTTLMELRALNSADALGTVEPTAALLNPEVLPERPIEPASAAAEIQPSVAEQAPIDESPEADDPDTQRQSEAQ
jgi:uncharacterized protein HemX